MRTMCTCFGGPASRKQWPTSNVQLPKMRLRSMLTYIDAHCIAGMSGTSGRLTELKGLIYVLR